MSSQPADHTRRVALGGLFTALGILLMLATGIFPLGTFALPALAGVLLLPLCIHMGIRWAALVYAATAVLSLLIAPDREAAFFYLGLFGHYPLLKAIIESKLPRRTQLVTKLGVFFLSVAACLGMTALTFGLEYLLAEYTIAGPWTILIVGVLACGVLLLYDLALSRIVMAYVVLLRPKLKRFFP